MRRAQAFRAYLKTGGANKWALINCIKRAEPLGRVLHVGAHTGEERRVYFALGAEAVTWVEASMAAYTELSNRHKKDRCVHACAWSRTGEVLTMKHLRRTKSWYSGRSTVYEIREPFTGEEFEPVAFEDVVTTALDDVLTPEFETLVIDVQGAELEALKGMPNIVAAASSIVVEACWHNVMGGPITLPGIIEFLRPFGYVMMYYQAYSQRATGDVLFQKVMPPDEVAVHSYEEVKC